MGTRPTKPVYMHAWCKELDYLLIILWPFSQRNFAPVDELREAVLVTNIEGEIPEDFPEGVYIRNGWYFNPIALY